MKVGPGWEHVAGPVFDHTSGLRIHLGGLARLPSGAVVYGTRWPVSQRMYRAIRVHGGNRRRGIMRWAMQLAAKAAKEKGDEFDGH